MNVRSQTWNCLDTWSHEQSLSNYLVLLLDFLNDLLFKLKDVIIKQWENTHITDDNGLWEIINGCKYNILFYCFKGK